jgi:enolase
MAADTITRVHAREVFDSRGDPTIEVEVHCESGAAGKAIVPAGASKGRHEAVELRDGDPGRFGGKGVRGAVGNVREAIQPHVLGLPVTDQERIDDLLCKLDGTADKSRLGSNAILGVSLACAHAAAQVRGMPLWRSLSTRATAPALPLPMVNMISGGLHAGGNLDFQDFLLLPVGAKSYSEALAMAANVYRQLRATLKDHGLESALVGDEGGFGPRLEDNQAAVSLLLEAVNRAGYVAGDDVALGIDVAATQFFQRGGYRLRGYSELLSAEDMIGLLGQWVDQYPLVSIEDPLAEDDWEGWQKLTPALGQSVQLIGDDLFATNPDRLRRGIEAGVANSVLIKLNQIGTLTETLRVVDMARRAGYRPVISARSGETEDVTIAHLAVATGAGQIKIGSVARSERLAKYNELLRIEDQFGEELPFSRWCAPGGHEFLARSP